MRTILCGVFFLSGAAALIFETLWFNLAGLTLGNSVWASSLVLASFMGGMALGNGLVGRYGHHLADAVRAYAWLEILIALTGLGLVLLLPSLNGILAPFLRPFRDLPWVLNPLRLTLGFTLLLVPAVAMGATLPVMVRGLRAREEGLGRILGLLYGLNTLGAVAGALLGEIVLIEHLGLRGTGFVAAGLDLLAATTAFALARRLRGASLDSAPSIRTVVQGAIPGRGRRLLAAAFLSGGILLALEVVWFRFMQLFVFGTTFNFAILLAVVLAGIGLGGLVASLWLARDRFERVLPVVALTAGALVSACYALFASGALGSTFENEADLWTDIGRAAGLMLPVCVTSGMIFTLTGQVLHRQMHGQASDVRAAGYLTLANTTGAMSGALLAGFLLLPWLGMERCFFLLGLAYLFVALLTLPPRGSPKGGLRDRWPMLAALGAYLAILGSFPFAVLRDRILPAILERFPAARLVASREGVSETIHFTCTERFGDPYSHRLITNGYSMSGTDVRDMRYMKFFVYLPQALHPDIRKVLLVSYGVGSTAKALTDTGSIERIDVVDISRDILDLSSIVFPRPEEHPLEDPRVRVHIEDGRFFLQVSEESYDLITSEPPPPKAARVTALYSKEYFQLLHDRLAEGGMVSYWLPVYQLSQSDSRAIVRAFCEVFDESSLWSGSGIHWMLLGVRGQGARVDQAHFRAQWNDPVVGPELRALGFEQPEQIGALFIEDGPALLELFADTPPLVDDFPHRLSPHPVTQGESRYQELMEIDRSRRRFETSAHIAHLWPVELRGASLPFFAYRHAINNVLSPRQKTGPQRFRFEVLHEILTRSTLRTLPLWLLSTDERELRIVEGLPATLREDAEVDRILGDGAMSERDFAAASAHYERGHERDPGRTELAAREIFALCLAGRTAQASERATRLAQLVPRDRELARFLSFLESNFRVRVR